MPDLNKLKEKLTAQRLRNEIAGAFNMHQSQEAKDNFNNEMVSKTWKYQKYTNLKLNRKKDTNFGM